MKQRLLILLSVIALNCFSQTAPAKGDYISCKTLGYEPVNYIFKNRKVFYAYYPATQKKTYDSYKQDAKLVKELFDMADAAGLDKMKSLDENSLLLEHSDYEYSFSILEYRKGEKTYRICWDPSMKDENSIKLNEISGKMTEFW